MLDHVLACILHIDVTEFHLAAGVDLACNPRLVSHDDQQVSRFSHFIKRLWNARDDVETGKQVGVARIVDIKYPIAVQENCFMHGTKVVALWFK